MWIDPLSFHLYSFTSDSLSGPTSSETNHKGLLLGIDTILGTELCGASIVGCQIDSEKTWNKQRLHCALKILQTDAIYPLHTQNPRCCFVAMFVYWHPASMNRMFCLVCCYLGRMSRIINTNVIMWSNHKHKSQRAIYINPEDNLLIILFTTNSWTTDIKDMTKDKTKPVLKIPGLWRLCNYFLTGCISSYKKLLSWPFPERTWGWKYRSLKLFPDVLKEPKTGKAHSNG